MGATLQNDVRGWVLVHDQIRAVLAEAPRQVRALRPEAPAAAGTFVRWWQSFSRSLIHHMHSEDERIWPVLAAAHPERVTELEGLTREHHAIDALLARVDASISQVRHGLSRPEFPSTREALAAELEALLTVVSANLEHEERTAFKSAVRVPVSEWKLVEKDMVKGLSLGDVSTLMPRILEVASPEDRTMMLARVPGPVRFLVTRVFEPRYRRLKAGLPAR